MTLTTVSAAVRSAPSTSPGMWPRPAGEAVAGRARDAGVRQADFGADDPGDFDGAMSKVIAMADGDDAVWRPHLGFVWDGLKGASGAEKEPGRSARGEP